MSWVSIGTAAVGAGMSYVQQKKAAKAGKPDADDIATKKQLLSNLQTGSPMALSMLGDAKQNLGASADWQRGILNGGYTGAMGAMNPEAMGAANANQGMYASALRNGARGSGTGSQRLGLMDNLSNNWNNAMIGLRPGAAGSLGQIGTQQGSLGGSVLSGGGSLGLGLLSNGMNQRQSQFDMARQSAASGTDWSGLIGSIFGAFSKGGNAAGPAAAGSYSGGAGVSQRPNLYPGTGNW